MSTFVSVLLGMRLEMLHLLALVKLVGWLIKFPKTRLTSVPCFSLISGKPRLQKGVLGLTCAHIWLIRSERTTHRIPANLTLVGVSPPFNLKILPSTCHTPGPLGCRDHKESHSCLSRFAPQSKFCSAI